MSEILQNDEANSTTKEIEMDEQEHEDVEGDDHDHEDISQKSQSSSDSSENEDEEESELHSKIDTLSTQISQNPFIYDNHIEKIKLLKQLGDLYRLRDARADMSKHFPLTEELWLDWLRDEIPLISEDKDKKRVEELFEKAFGDYQSVPVWLEYVQYAIGLMKEKNGLPLVRDAFERALSAVGLHVSQGSNIWDAYREFENAILSGLIPQPGAVVTKEDEEAFALQNQKVHQLFKRQLAVPLLYMQNTLDEYKEWLGEDIIDINTQKAFDKAFEKLQHLQAFEDKLINSEIPQLQTYQEYIQYELKSEDPSRIQCIFERALKENCLNTDLWLQYTTYMDKLKLKEQIESVYERAVRNCPWSSQLWVKYLLAMERQSAQFEKMKGLAERALLVGFSQASDYLSVWCQYCDYLKRRINWDADHEETLETFRLSTQSAVNYMFENFGNEGDPGAVLQQYLSFVEAKFCKNMERAREIWNEVMQAGHGAEAAMWLQYYRLERMFGDSKHCRRILQKALNSVTDWPESITQAYIQFEREEGNLEQYDMAVLKCEAQLERINERRAQSEQSQQELKTKDQQAHGEKTFPKKRKQVEAKYGGAGDSGLQKKRKVDHLASAKDSAEPAVKKVKEEIKEELQEENPTSDKQEDSSRVISEEESNSRVILHGESVKHDPSKDNITVFVSNLDFSVEDEIVKGFFEKCGEITNIRLVRNYKGKSKGFGYVEFTDSNAVLKALKLDREFINGRPVFVSRCEDRSVAKSQPLKFSTNLEKNKLFIKGLPFTMTKEDLETMFQVHGKLKDVRMVTYRNGKPKGIAYVEFTDEQSASQAVLKTDGTVIGDNTISVALSHPPERKTSLLTRSDLSLGSGKKETAFRGKARTQVTLLPRALRQSGQQDTGSGDSSQEKVKTETTSMNNADFRAMLLKK
ncbi:squamous cell carcinoma antigen recognized by T-cells 3-like isoform X3 [Biomphalaria glabrata]|nr:squamous cell carcinoma antigen recognized by T-cells 3-like isoform X3 [Biomphalaria glabrata]XP_055862469.1 squamous cell carcinoma antigen recognized by T-cells 3-like isoform X3 [Biomphalaria glabrata]KAI8782889.1 squamous cell carcinoma antigen recognized by T-cells 3 [Biomphalaria glabrata]